MSDRVVKLEELTFMGTDCIVCGVRFYVPHSMYEQAKKRGGYFHCPSGHSQGWAATESEDARIRRERDSLKQQMARVEDEKREAEHRAELAEARERRLKKRAAAGTCPCCKRTFSNMNTHMRKEHPNFVAENVVKLRA